MERSLFTLGRAHPYRPPDWRWRLGNYLADCPEHPMAQANADLWTVQAALLARELRTSPAAELSDPSALRIAYDIYSAEDQMPRWVLEARLLTGEPFSRTARHCGLGLDVLGAYAEVFFNVRDRLEASSYVAHFVIGSKLHYGLTEDDHAILLKIAGFHGLGESIGALACHFQSPPLESKDFDVTDLTTANYLRDKLQLKAWVFGLTVPGNEAGLLAAEVVCDIQKLLHADLPAEGDEVGVQALAARLRLVNSALDGLRDCLAEERRRT